jgi:hypothetical protein
LPSVQVARVLPWICAASGLLTICVGLHHLFVAIPFMLVTLGICAISLIVVLVAAARASTSETDFPGLGLALSLTLLSPVPYVLLVLVLMGNYWG